jgi:arabinofuranosyltransferase
VSAALGASVVLLYVVVGWQRRWMVDDAFINFRVVKQIEAGNGPVFNIGERVEVATSTLWLLMLTIGDIVSPVRLEYTAVLLQLACGGVGVAAGLAGAARLQDLRDLREGGERPSGLGGVVVPVGALAYFAVTGAWDFATGGLENGLALAWLGTAFLTTVEVATRAAAGRPVGRRVLAGAGVVIGLGVLVRPDLAPVCAGFGLPVAVVAWRASRWRGLAVLAAAAGLLPLAVQVFRMGYYAQLVPNTLHAKEGGEAWWDQGVTYLGNFAGTYRLVVPIALAAVLIAVLRPDGPHGRPGGGPVDEDGDRAAARRLWLLVVLGLEAGALLQATGIVRAGGDFMHARLLLPAWFALLLPVFAVRAGDLRRPAVALPVAGLAAWALASAALLRPPPGQMLTVAATERLGVPVGLPASRLVGVVDHRTTTLAASGDPHPVRVESFRPPDLRWWRPDPATPHWFDPELFPPDEGRGLPAAPAFGAPVVSTALLGTPGYTAALDVYVYDRLGLAHAVTARVELDHRGTPGHEKALPPWWVAALFVDPAARLPDSETFDITAPFAWNLAGVRAPQALGPAAFADARDAGARALTCGELGELQEDIHGPMTVGRFLGNVVDAVRLHSFRVPADANEAVARFCR